jgi:hypothetical protein
MTMASDDFAEFDNALAPSPEETELLDLDVPADEQLPAALADPMLQDAKLVDPKTYKIIQGAKTWNRVSLPLRIRAFYAWLDLGDLSRVAVELNVKRSTLETLRVKDSWQARAEQIRAGLDHSIQTSWLEARRRGLSFFLEYIECIDPTRLASMSTPADVAKLAQTMVGLGGGVGNVTVHGNAQIVAPGAVGGQANLTGAKPAQELSDAELLAEAKRLGVPIQAPPPPVVTGRAVAAVEAEPVEPAPAPTGANLDGTGVASPGGAGEA